MASTKVTISHGSNMILADGEKRIFPRLIHMETVKAIWPTCHNCEMLTPTEDPSVDAVKKSDMLILAKMAKKDAATSIKLLPSVKPRFEIATLETKIFGCRMTLLFIFRIGGSL